MPIPFKFGAKSPGNPGTASACPTNREPVPTSCARWRRADRAGPNVLRTTPIENGLRCQSNSRLDHWGRHPPAPTTAFPTVSPGGRFNSAFMPPAVGRHCSAGGEARFMTVPGTRGSDCGHARHRRGQAQRKGERIMTPESVLRICRSRGSVSQAGSSGWPQGPRPSGEVPQEPATPRLKCPPLPSQAPAGFVRAWRSRQSSR